ncbi:phosphopantetheine-binding protein [Polymorphospora lycopeni]|uniref:Phosphopantetheine-binding protein n=1 Tax=Polymorphospora lycopeni TaxID=3140240 RepID=A0ABV5CTP9_9ACTN
MEPLTPSRLRAELAEALGEPLDDLTDDDDLFAYGLDSMTFMSLVERWRRQGVEASYVTLAERPTIASWSTMLAG